MVFFARELKYPAKTTMWKVLGELDFRHFQETGAPVTFVHYKAYPNGPVPHDLHVEITRDLDVVIPDDMRDSLRTTKEVYAVDEDRKPRFTITFHALRSPDLSIFTPRQQRIMKEVADIYKTTSAKDASRASHEPGKPWTVTVARKGEGEFIDYLDLIDKKSKITRGEAAEKMKEMLAFQHNHPS
jgi:hypothetical protein